jgi:hypothetical protein
VTELLDSESEESVDDDSDESFLDTKIERKKKPRATKYVFGKFII